MERLIGACGIICTECAAYKATKANNDELRAKTAKEWSKMYNAEIKAEHINCEGCMADGVKLGHCNECKMRACVVSKGYQNCSECAEYPCKMMEEFIKVAPFTKEVIESLR